MPCLIEDLCWDRQNYILSGRLSLFLTSISTLGGGLKWKKVTNSLGKEWIGIITNLILGSEKGAMFLKSGISLSCKEFWAWVTLINRLEDFRLFVGSKITSKDGAKTRDITHHSNLVLTFWTICRRYINGLGL